MHPLRTAAGLHSPDFRDRDRFDSAVSVQAPPAAVEGGGQYVPPDVSYERDFAPLAQRYFKQTFGAGMKPMAAARVFFPAVQQLQGAYAGTAQMRGIDEQSRNRRVDYEKSVFALESARNAARKEREMMDSLVPVQGFLSGIVEDLNTDNPTKMRAIGRFELEHAGLAGVNPLVSGAFAAARKSVVPDEDDRSKFTAKDFFNASRGMGAEFLQKEAERRGRPLLPDDELDFNEATKELQRLNVDYRDTRADQERKAKEEAASAKAETFALKRVSDLTLKKGDLELDPSTKEYVHPMTLPDKSDIMFVDSVVAKHGTPAERKAYAALGIPEKVEMAKKIAGEVQLGLRAPAEDKVRAMISTLTE